MASEIKVNNIKRATGTTITLGESGDTVALACGASSTGFAALSWCAAIKSTAFCASAGKGYFVNTCAGGVTATLPATASAGDTIEFKDYKRTWGTNQLTVNSNSLNYQGSASATIGYGTDGLALKVVYADVTRGWTPTVDDDAANVHTYNVQYLVVAGGGGGGQGDTAAYAGGGGGAGGLRTVGTKSFAVTKGSTIPVTVGGGGTAPGADDTLGGSGDNSGVSTIPSAGGGGGGRAPSSGAGLAGGSGGGGGNNPAQGGAGNTPPTPCTQGNPGGTGGDPSGGTGTGANQGAGGGGHASAGTNATSCAATPGGPGTTSCISGSPVAYAGGGGGANYSTPPSAVPGGGGSGAKYARVATAGGTNTGGGGGGGARNPGGESAAGGPGIVIIRRLTACSTTTSGTVTTCGSDTIHTFTGDGTFVV